MQTKAAVNRWHYPGLALVLLTYLALAQFYQAAIPFGKGPDELTYYLYARFISDYGRLPMTWAERTETSTRAYLPPLYHLAVAGLMDIVRDTPPPDPLVNGDVRLTPSLKVIWEPATRQLIDIILPRATLVQTEDERPPYRGEYLAWVAGRWVSMALSAGTILLTFLMVRSLLPQRPGFALITAALLAFIPTFLFISAVLNDDNMVGLTMAGYLLLLVWFLRGRDSIWLYLGMGLLIGLAIITKYNCGLIVLSATLSIGLGRKVRGWRWRDVVGRVGLIWLATALGAIGWFAWGVIYFNKVADYGLISGLLNPFIPDVDPAANRLLSFFSDTISDPGLPTNGISGNFWDWLRRTFETTWALTVFGVQPYPIYWPIITVLALLTLISLAGLWFTFRRSDLFQRMWLVVFLLHFIVIFPLPLVRFFLTYRINDSAQGRHIFYPAAPVIIVLLLVGWEYWLKPAHKKWAAGLGASALLTWAVFHGWYLWLAYPPPLPVRTTPGPQMAVAQPTSVTFRALPLDGQTEVDLLTLTGYETHLINHGSVLELILRWQSLAQAAEDYRTEITLIDTAGVSQLQWLSHPVDGRFPVRAWQPGDMVRDTLFIPLVGLAPGEYQIRLRLLGWDNPLGEPVELTKIQLPTAPPLDQPHQAATLWQQGQVLKSQPVYRYRSTIPVTLSEPVAVKLSGPDGQLYSPVTSQNHLHIFMVDYDWPSGQYRLEGGDEVTGLWVENFNWNFSPPAMMHEVNANFNNEVMLLGYNLPSNRVMPGRGLPLVLYWQSLTQMRHSYTIFSNLLDNQQQKWGGYDRLPKEVYNTFLWVPGEVVDDGFAVPVDPEAPNGIYHISLGLYLEQEGQAISLPLVQDGQRIDPTSVTIGPIKVGGPPPGVVLSSQEIGPHTSLSIKLGEPPVILLRGYDLTQANNTLKLTLYWESLAQTRTDWITFIHLRNEAGETVAQKDGPTGSGLYPTSLWDGGEIIADHVILPMDTLSDGDYDLFIGLYDLATGSRLAVTGNPAGEILLVEAQ